MSKQIEELRNQVLELLIEFGLNWTVTKEPLFSSDGKPTSSFGLFRSDTKQHLATVKSRYEVYDNHQLVEAMLEATANIDMNVTNGGVLKDGQRVYLQAELPEVYIGKSGMKRQITGVNSHGEKAIGFGSSGTVIVCNNTWMMSYGELSKFRHTISAAERVKLFIEGMRQAMGLDEGVIRTFKKMADVRLKDEVFARVIQRCFQVDIDEKQDKLSTRTINKMKKVNEAIETELELEGDTLWGLFNGITRFTNHIAPVKPKIEITPELKKEYVMVGEGYETNLKAYQTIREWLIEQGMIENNLVLS